MDVKDDSVKEARDIKKLDKDVIASIREGRKDEFEKSSPFASAMAIKQFCCDDETGEILTYHVNEETGERLTEANFPPVYISPKKSRTSIKPPKYMNFPKGYVSQTKKFKLLKDQILSGSNKISHRLLLIPTLAIFPAYMCTLIIILEVFLHARCHINNKLSKDPDTYYRSPFHMITSTFCGVCRDCHTASKIGKLQDQRRSRYDCFKNIVI